MNKVPYVVEIATNEDHEKATENSDYIDVLEECHNVALQRGLVYGEWSGNMAEFARILNGFLKHKLSRPLDERDAAMVYVATKISRMIVGDATHRDNMVDAINYLAMAVKAGETGE